MTEVILEKLGSAEFLVLTADADWAAAKSERDVPVLVGDSSDEETLLRAQIEDAAAVLVAINNDPEDALAVLTARQLNPNIWIIAGATNRENIEKLRRVGADVGISPATIGGHLLVESAFGNVGMESVAKLIVVTEELPAPEDARTASTERIHSQ
ncbi:MAG: TrkA family potassium uptake protein [Halobacteriales archaeon]